MIEPLRILQVVGKMDRAGAETLLMNLYRRMDRAVLQFDFLLHRAEPGDYDDEICALGGRLHYAPPMRLSHPLEYRRALSAFFASNSGYRVVHAHIDALSALPLLAARHAGVPCRIAHSHNTAFPRDFKYPVRYAARALLAKQATDLFACSGLAGDFLFPPRLRGGRLCTVLHNGVELSDFRYSPEARDTARASLGLSDSLVFGHIGRFCVQKNHSRLLDIFANIHMRCPKSVLLLAGEGELLTPAKEKAVRLGIAPHVRFLGVRSDIPRLLQAMDVLLLPSLYEGLPVVGVEAQAAGLPCVFSSAITPDIGLTEPVAFIPLSAPDNKWADAALRFAGCLRKDTCAALAAQGYDIAQSAAWLQAFYLGSRA